MDAEKSVKYNLSFPVNHDAPKSARRTRQERPSSWKFLSIINGLVINFPARRFLIKSSLKKNP